jgi:2-amino-4-hydroxy-6-hydroxymethyldihydropteridine pyrophosphokinase
MNDCIIGIGSNIDVERNIPKAILLLGKLVEVIQVSGMIKTSPIGIKDQPDFTNGAVRIKTGMGLNELNQILKKLEDEMGRDRTQPKFGARNIDLDILIWNNEIVDQDYFTRDFLRISAAELGFENNK